MSFERFAWMLSDSRAAPKGTPSESEVNSAAELLIGCWQVSPCTLPRFRIWAQKAPNGAAAIQRVESVAVAASALVRLQMLILRQIGARFAERDIPYVVLKSSAIRLLAYALPGQRAAQDIDIGVPRSEIGRAAEVIEELGFHPAQWREAQQCFEPAESTLRAAVERGHYELGFFVRRQLATDEITSDEMEHVKRQLDKKPAAWKISDEGEVECYLVVDLHHGISREVDVDDIVASSVRIDVSGLPLPVPRPAWLLFHLVFKVYWEGVASYLHGGYQFADLCRYANRLLDDECEVFGALIRRWRLEAAAYYTLRRVESDLGVKLSPPLRALVDACAQPDLTVPPERQNDRGDMWPKLWGGR